MRETNFEMDWVFWGSKVFWILIAKSTIRKGLAHTYFLRKQCHCHTISNPNKFLIYIFGWNTVSFFIKTCLKFSPKIQKQWGGGGFTSSWNTLKYPKLGVKLIWHAGVARVFLFKGLEDTACYAGLFLAPAEGFGRGCFGQFWQFVVSSSNLGNF